MAIAEDPLPEEPNVPQVAAGGKPSHAGHPARKSRQGQGGGPKSTLGKRKSSMSATKHGVYSVNPVIGGETVEDWDEHRNGIRESFMPQSYGDEVICENIALNRWKRKREELWYAKKIGLQVDSADDFPREAIDPKMMDVPDDEKAWWHSDPAAAFQVAQSLTEGDLETDLDPYKVMDFAHAFERCAGHALPAFWLDGAEGHELPAFKITAKQLLDVVQEDARSHGMEPFRLLGSIELEAGRATIHQQLRRREETVKTEEKRVSALILSDSEFSQHERRVNLLEKEYDRLVRRLEISQRARGGMLPAPIRLQVGEE